MNYRLIYNETAVPRPDTRVRSTVWTEEFATEHQALERARELLETGEHHGVVLHDYRGNAICGVPLQLKLGGFSGD